MTVKIMTILSSNTFCCNLIEDNSSFAFKLLSKSDNFISDTLGIADLEDIAMLYRKKKQNTTVELIPHLDI